MRYNLSSLFVRIFNVVCSSLSQGDQAPSFEGICKMLRPKCIQTYVSDEFNAPVRIAISACAHALSELVLAACIGVVVASDGEAAR